MNRTTERIRHELRFRLATVVRNERLTPRMARLTLHSPDFAQFRSDAHDDHVKLFFAPPGEVLRAPAVGANGLAFPDGLRPAGRDYTPRRFDRDRCELVVDFVLHGDGPAALWATSAAPGDTIGVGGPRASFVLRDAYEWYLLAGDETALPAIGRRIEELPDSAIAIAIIEIADAGERQIFHTPAHLELRWVFRDEGGTLLDAVRHAVLPAGRGHAFVAGESAVAAALRTHLIEDRGLPRDQVRAAGYWRRGEADFDDGHAH